MSQFKKTTRYGFSKARGGALICACLCMHLSVCVCIHVYVYVCICACASISLNMHMSWHVTGIVEPNIYVAKCRI